MSMKRNNEESEFSQFIIRTIAGDWVCNIAYKESITSSDLMRAKLVKDWDPKKYVVATERKAQTVITEL